MNSFSKNEDKTHFGGLTRSALMSRIRAKGNASTEMKFLTLMRAAKIKGWRRNYPLLGKPDVTFPKARLAVFIDGCFWHGHNCTDRKPKRNTEAWLAKFARNRKRDRSVTRKLKSQGWTVVRIWECKLAKQPNHCIATIASKLIYRR